MLARAGETPEADVDAQALPLQPVRLVLPPCGSVEVALRGPKGEPAHARAVTLADASGAGDGALDAPLFSPTELVPGRALFPFVGLGLSVEVSANGGSKRAAKKRAPGPRAAGESVAVTIEFDEAPIWIVGRVLHPGDQPYAGRTLQGTLEGSFGASGMPVSTDAAGRVRFASPVPASKLGLAVLRIVAREGGRELKMSARFPANVPAGEVDLGDLRPEVPLVLARGRVVDDLGEPVAGALIVAQTDSASDATWTTDARIAVTAPEPGAFEITGPWTGARVRVIASRSGHASAAPIELQKPGEEHRIVLARAASILGRLVLDEGALPADVEIRVVRRDALAPELARAEGRQGATIAADGSFALHDVRAGIVDLHFAPRPPPGDVQDEGARPLLEPWLVLDGIELLPGERATDARLDAVDLRGRVPRRDAPR
jgi:hypothetical protein